MLDFLDFTEEFNNKRKEGAAAFKEFMAGPRWAGWLSHIERSIQGPYFYGEKPSYVDYYVGSAFEMGPNTFQRLVRDKEGMGDMFAAAPKLKAVAAATITKELTAKIDKAMLPDFLGPTQEEIDSYGPSMSKLQLLYHEAFTGRAMHTIYMLEASGTDYEWKMDWSYMSGRAPSDSPNRECGRGLLLLVSPVGLIAMGTPQPLFPSPLCRPPVQCRIPSRHRQ